MAQYFLLPLAVIPPILFMLYIYWMDRHKPESMKHVLIALLLGALSTVPAVIVQLALDFIPLFSLPGTAGSFFESFFLVAPSEEFFKFIVIYLFVKRKAFFDEVNDGIVYYGTGAIGFALLENILYVFGNGVGTGLLRAFTSIPLHTFCGVIVGYHAGLARFGGVRHPVMTVLRGIIIAIVTHALYNTLALSGSLWSLLFIPVVLIVYIIGFLVVRKGRKLSLAGIFHGGYSSEADGSYQATVPGESQVLTDEFGRRYFKARKAVWKAVISRILLVVCVLVWILVIWAGADSETSMLDLIFGTFILTIIPMLIGIVLEISYQRGKRRRIYLY